MFDKLSELSDDVRSKLVKKGNIQMPLSRYNKLLRDEKALSLVRQEWVSIERCNEEITKLLNLEE